MCVYFYRLMSLNFVKGGGKSICQNDLWWFPLGCMFLTTV